MTCSCRAVLRGPSEIIQSAASQGIGKHARIAAEKNPFVWVGVHSVFSRMSFADDNQNAD